MDPKEENINELGQNNNPPNETKFDILKIDSIINKSEKYEEDGNIFIYCNEYKENKETVDQKTDYAKYFASINNTFQYLGILSHNLKKDTYGFNHFDNGDEYLGQWNKDKKEGHGIYFFNKEAENNCTNELYVGEFKNNVKSGEGVYFSVSKFTERVTNSKTEKVPENFILAVGNFSEDYFTDGKIYTYEEGKCRIYIGGISADGKKNDEKGEMYENKVRIFHGVIKDNLINEGRIIFKENDKKVAYYYKKGGNNGEDEFDYLRGEEEDEEYMERLNTMNSTFKYEKLQDLFLKIVEYQNKGKDFNYMKKLDYDNEVKKVLKDQYGKLIYC